MRSRLVLMAALSVAAAAIAFTGVRFRYLPAPVPPAHAHLKPAPVSYLGVYETGSPPGYQPIATFAQTVGKPPNIIGYYSGWAESFSKSFARRMYRHGLIPFVQIDPKYASLPGIATGVYDIYLRAYANSVRDFRHAVIIGFGHEMNASWYSWGYHHVSPATFIAAWRHIVKLFRAQGAGNVTWLWTVNTVNHDRPGSAPVAPWWPGARYVTWVGIDGYYFRPSDTFASVFGRTISQVRKFTTEPILLSEAGVGPRAGQLAKIVNLFSGMARAKMLGIVWFDKFQHQGIYHQNWRIEGNPPATTAFKLGLSSLRLKRPLTAGR